MGFFERLRRKPEDDDGEPEGELEGRRAIYATATNSAYQVRKSIGWKIRDGVGYLEGKLGPYLKKIFPNFIAVHYGYIIFMAILGSIIMYPMKNAKYIDILFFSACAATQAGLNTVDVNDLELYQQISIYVIAMLCTPIFIHGSLAFLRLYWFERHFDDIRETSKLNFKMRRTATLAARTQSMDRSRTMDSLRSRSVAQQIPQVHPQPPVSVEDSSKDSPGSKTADDGSSSSSALSIPPQLPPSDYTQSQSDLFHQADGVHHMSEPSSEDEEPALPPQSRTIKFVSDENDEQADKSAIKFADLPKPTKQNREDLDPTDVYRSIAMMRHKQANSHYDSGENEGPALIVHGPAERASDSKKKKGALQFDLAKPKRPIHNRKRSGIRRSFLLRRGNDADIDDVIEGDKDGQNISGDDGDNELERAQTHLPLPSANQSGGIKFTKRSNTLDVPTTKMDKSPTFDKFVKRTLKAPRVLRRRLSSNAIDDQSDFDPTDSDDGEHSGDEDEDDDDDDEDHSLRRQMSTTYLSWIPTVGRNSTFVNLSDRQKEELGGVEYRAIKLLGKILIVYYLGFHIIGVMFLLPWIIHTQRFQDAVSSSGVSLTWWGFFTSASAFNDLGYTLTPNSMISFRDSTYALLVVSVLIIIGNTGFPILLRFIIWVLFKFSKDLSLFKESLGFLLDHPRRCFTLLFPSAPTWWLFFILLVMNVVDLILFIVLDLNAEVVEDLSAGHKVLDGFFQAVSTRTAGFACVDLSQLHPAVQVSYMVMMYISVLPLAISIRRTNVYEEQSLGVYAGKSHEQEASADENQKATSFIGAHLRKQLSFDLWFVFLGLFVICIAEGGRIQNEDMPAFGVFQIMFEVVSAYGTVGMSLGYPGTDPSFSAKFTVLSKLVIIAMMIRGRHRGLPYSLDRAIMLPSAKMEKRDRYQALHAGNTMARTESIGSEDDPVIEFFKSAAPKVVRERMKRPSFFSSKSYTRSHRRMSSNVSNASEGSGPSRPTRADLDIEQTGDYLRHTSSHTTDNHAFRDVHFNHTLLEPIQSSQSRVEEYGPKEAYELDDLGNVDGGPVRVAETDVHQEPLAMGSRKNSTQTF